MTTIRKKHTGSSFFRGWVLTNRSEWCIIIWQEIKPKLRNICYLGDNMKRLKQNGGESGKDHMTAGLCIGMCIGMCVGMSTGIGMTSGMSVGMAVGMLIGSEIRTK